MIASAARFTTIYRFPDYLGMDVYASGERPPRVMRRVVLYGRPGCCLCDDALAVIERVRARTPFALQTLDIELTRRCTPHIWSGFRLFSSTVARLSSCSSMRRHFERVL